MTETNMKVYVVLKDFTIGELAYTKGMKYELADEAVATLKGGTVELYVEPPKEPEASTQGTGEPAKNTAGSTAPEKPKEKAKPWAGNHTVGS